MRTVQDIAVRLAKPQDAAALSALSEELGYVVSATGLPERLEAIEDSGGVVLVAVERHDLLGWVQIGMPPALVAGAEARVLGLVVTARQRGRGVGRILMDAAEAWAREEGAEELILSSNITRTFAHAFYEHIGFKKVKTQHVFRKSFND